MIENKIEYIARHYRQNSFNKTEAWKKMNPSQVSIRKKYWAAAAVILIAVLTGTAAILIRTYRSTSVETKENTELQSTPTGINANCITIIDFEDASLKEVIVEIENAYGIKIYNLPNNIENYRLSLHYEGTPSELIDVINDILGTQMTVE